MYVMCVVVLCLYSIPLTTPFLLLFAIGFCVKEYRKEEILYYNIEHNVDVNVILHIIPNVCEVVCNQSQ